MLSSPILISSAHLSPPSNSMFPDLLTRRITRTETLGPGLVSVRPPPLSFVVQPTTFPHERKKRPLEDDEEATESRKRRCPSVELCMFCGRPAEEPKKSIEKKENCNPSGLAPTLLATKSAPPLPSPAPATIQQAATPIIILLPPLCKMGRKKLVLDKEIYRPVQRPQPFHRLPTAVNKKPIEMRNNLRKIYLGTKTAPEKVRYARDAVPRPRRGTPPSNPAHRGDLRQPIQQGRHYRYSVASETAAAAGLPRLIRPSLFLGSGARAWRRDTEHLESVPDRVPRLEGEDTPEPRTLTIRHVESGARVQVCVSLFAEGHWQLQAGKLRDMLKQRVEKERGRGRRPKPPVLRGRQGWPAEELVFPIVPSKLRVELARRFLDGGDEEDMMEVDDATPSEADLTDIEES